MNLESILSKAKAFASSIVFRNPFLFSIFLNRRFGVEQKLIAGDHHNDNKHPSIIHFSLNKAATQFTKKVLKKAAIENGMVPVHINEYAFFTKFPYLTGMDEKEMFDYAHIFKPKGYMYSAFGGYVPGIMDLEKYKVILMVRDPRDILVSWYYSIAFSHSIPPQTSNRHQEYIDHRASAQKMTIDEHVISQSDRVFNIFNRYKNSLCEPYPEIHLTSYEKMTSDFKGWLTGLLNACELDVSDQLLSELIEYNQSVQPKGENKFKHIRKGEPGDYADKLQLETIDYLNQKFAPIFDAFADVL
ncbi:MAG: sulfotransferase domain-containing protein [Anaerolineales bacterium]